MVQTQVGPLEGVWQRLQKKKNIRRTGARQHARQRKAPLKSIRLLYLFEWKVDLKPKWMLLERVQKAFNERWEGHAIRAMREAIETSRERAAGKG